MGSRELTKDAQSPTEKSQGGNLNLPNPVS